MSDTWDDIQDIKTKRSSLKARLLKRKQERAELQATIINPTSSTTPSASLPANENAHCKGASKVSSSDLVSSSPTAVHSSGSAVFTSPTTTLSGKIPAQQSLLKQNEEQKYDHDIEPKLLLVLLDIGLDIPSDAHVIAEQTSKMLGRDVKVLVIENLLEKFAAQQLISIMTSDPGKKSRLRVASLNIGKITDLASERKNNSKKRKREEDVDSPQDPPPKQVKVQSGPETQDSIEDLLSYQSAKEKETKKMNEEILQLLSQPTTKEKILVESFKSQGGKQLQEFCPCGTKEECRIVNRTTAACKKLHFKKIIHGHTDESLGDCSFLNTCFHMDTCKYVHYEIDYPETSRLANDELTMAKRIADAAALGKTLYPPQWIQCDLRHFDMTTLGKCAVIMADPPWDIHMELPYGTMSDDEMRKLDVPVLQDDGFLFLWVTGRAMELGRECLNLWGYKRVDELIWVKTNQLQRIIRTGRTGHWLNHGKEHCLVGVKGNPKEANNGLDCDVLVAEVRATSHKPDEVYGIIERLSPGTRKVELFGRPHNVQPNWITLGNQVEGVRLKDPDIVSRFKQKYPDGNCMAPPKNRQ